MAKFPRKEETNLESELQHAPEKDLWTAVLAKAAVDAFKGPPDSFMQQQRNHYSHYRDQARQFFLGQSAHFKKVCEMAGRDPTYVHQKMKHRILKHQGWNVDVPVTSHYRQGVRRKRGKYKTKHLTGNAYYAAKASQGPKNFYYQGMGRKGGRPRVYNVI